MTAAARTKTSLRRRTVLAAAIAAIGLASAASFAVADTAPVDLTVVDRETGQPLQVWRHHGRAYIAGEPGARYGLRLTNHTGGRVLVVLSVDGVNVVSGETAGFGQRGYVFGPYASYDVNGWRKSTSEIAAFTFAALPQSYAARTGRPGDVGVIGMAVFEEKAPVPVPEVDGPPPAPDWRPGDSSRAAAAPAMPPPPIIAPPAPMFAPPPIAAPAPPPIAAAQSQKAEGAVAERREDKLGTAHGAREWSVVNLTTFERASPYPQSTRQIEYDTYDNLVASGVIPSWRGEAPHPRPFPAQPDGAGFVPDPPAGF